MPVRVAYWWKTSRGLGPNKKNTSITPLSLNLFLFRCVKKEGGRKEEEREKEGISYR